MAERLVVTQAICDQVKFMTAGGAQVEVMRRLLGISPATIGRIKQAGYSADVFHMKKEERRHAEEQKRKMEQYMAENTVLAPEQVPGQMEMELPQGNEISPRASLGRNDSERIMTMTAAMKEQAQEIVQAEEQKKLYRFLAGQFDEVEIAIGQKLDKIYDMMGQILRAIRKE